MFYCYSCGHSIRAPYKGVCPFCPGGQKLANRFSQRTGKRLPPRKQTGLKPKCRQCGLRGVHKLDCSETSLPDFFQKKGWKSDGTLAGGEPDTR